MSSSFRFLLDFPHIGAGKLEENKLEEKMGIFFPIKYWYEVLSVHREMRNEKCICRDKYLERRARRASLSMEVVLSTRIDP